MNFSSTGLSQQQRHHPNNANPLLRPPNKCNTATEPSMQQYGNAHLSSQPPVSFDSYIARQRAGGGAVADMPYGTNPAAFRTTRVQGVVPSQRHARNDMQNNDSRGSSSSGLQSASQRHSYPNPSQGLATNQVNGHPSRDFSRPQTNIGNNNVNNAPTRNSIPDYLERYSSRRRSAGTSRSVMSPVSGLSTTSQHLSQQYDAIGRSHTLSTTGNEQLIHNFVQTKPTFRPGGGNNVTISKSSTRTMQNNNNVTLRSPDHTGIVGGYQRGNIASSLQQEQALSASTQPPGSLSRMKSSDGTRGRGSKLNTSRMSNDGNRNLKSRPVTASPRPANLSRSNSSSSFNKGQNTQYSRTVTPTSRRSTSQLHLSHLNRSHSESQVTQGVQRNEAQAKYDSGIQSYDSGKFEEALDEFQEALNLYSKLNTDNTELLANIFMGMGISYYKQGRSDVAMELYSRCIDTLESKFGKDYPGMVSVLVNMGLVQQLQQEYQNALQTYIRAQKLAENILGADRLGLADIYHNIGVIYDCQTRNEDALAMYKRSLRIREKILGEYHSMTALTYENMAMIHKDIQQLDEAWVLQSKVVKIRKKNNGMQTCDYAQAVHNLALILSEQKKYTLAIQYLERAVELRSQLLGPSHPLTTASEQQLEECQRRESKKSRDSMLRISRLSGGNVSMRSSSARSGLY